MRETKIAQKVTVYIPGCNKYMQEALLMSVERFKRKNLLRTSHASL